MCSNKHLKLLWACMTEKSFKKSLKFEVFSFKIILFLYFPNDH